MILSDKDIDLGEYLAFLGKQESQEVLPVTDFAHALFQRLELGNAKHGPALPWIKTHDTIRFQPGELSIWAGINGHGKALAVDTPIPTPTGWSTMGDLKAGDAVFDESGKQCRVVAATDVMENRPCYQLTFSDGTTVTADANHQWLTWSPKARQSWRNGRKNNRNSDRKLAKFGSDQSHKREWPSIHTSEDIARTLEASEGCWAGLTNHSVSVCGAIQTEKEDFEIDPYVLGVWLGDGNSNSAGLTTADEFIVNQMVANGINVRKRAGPLHYGLTGGLQAKLRFSGLLNNKHIPASYLRGSLDQRLALLQGLMDTDGSITDYGRCEFTSVNERLADETLELVLSLGIQAKKVTGRAMLYGKDCGPKFRVTFTPNIPVFRLARKLSRCKTTVSERIRHRFIVKCERVESVPVRCIQVDSPSSLFLCSRAFIPTHNSLLLGQVILWWLKYQTALIASLEMKPVETLYRMARQMRGGMFGHEYLDEFMSGLDGKLWIYDQLDSVQSDRILGLIHYAASELKTDHIVIDSLTKCGLSRDDYAVQARFVDRIQWAAKRHNVHVHLVCHMRKGNDENTRPGKFDIRGAAEISDLADNVLVIYRNKPKEEAQKKRESGQMLSRAEEMELSKPDTILRVDKNRANGEEASFGLWYHQGAMQFLATDLPQSMTWSAN